MSKADRTIALAVDAERDGDWELARALLVHAVSREPGNDRAWALLAHVAGDPQLAVACLKEAVSLNPSNDFATHELRRRHRGQERSDADGAPGAAPAPRLGEHLVRQHGLDWVAMMRALLRQRELEAEGTQRPLGEVLVEMGLLDEAALRRAIEEQRQLKARVA
jgi:hypothetical protein